MIVEVACAGAKFCPGLAILIQATLSKTLIGSLIVMREIQIVLDECGAGIRVVADTIPPDPGVQEGKREQKEDKQDPFESALLLLALKIQARINSPRKTSTANWNSRCALSPTMRRQGRPGRPPHSW
jgi:hypothetical protein